MFSDRYGFVVIMGMGGLGFILWLVACGLLYDRRWAIGCGVAFVGLGLCGVACASIVIGCLPGNWHRCLCDGEDHSENRQPYQHNYAIVPQKHLTNTHYWGTVIT